VTRIVVVGAGLLGASVAYHLARSGAETTVLEAGRPAAATSGSTFAWVNAQDKSPGHYFALNRDGVDAYPALAEALGGDWYHPGGHLVIGSGSGAEATSDRIARHEALGYPVRRLDHADLSRLEPGVDPGDAEVVIGHFPTEAWVDVPSLVGRLLAGARAGGAVVRTGAPVGRFDVTGGRVEAVVLEGGERVPTEIVLLAAGPRTEALADTIGVRVPMAPTPGLLAITEPVASGIARVVQAGDVTLRPDGGGRLLLASRAIDRRLEPGVDDVPIASPLVVDLLAAAGGVVPALRDALVESTRIGVRSIPADGQPAIGFAPDVESLYVLASHSGVTLASVLGALVAGELLGRADPRLEPYRVTRFAGAVA
jgi:glycine/D-amino acid oxidase-like deaminating enzyme